MNPDPEYMDVDVSVTTKYPADLAEDNGPDYDGIQQQPVGHDDKSEGGPETGTNGSPREEKEETGEISFESEESKIHPLEKAQNVRPSVGVAEEKSTLKKLRPDAIHWEDGEDPIPKDDYELFDERPATLNEWLNDVSCVRGLMSESRKRMYMEANRSRQQPIEEMSETTVKKMRKNPWGTLSQTWGQNDAVEEECFQPKVMVKKPNNYLKERLGVKSSALRTSFPPIPTEDDDDDDESNTRSNGEKCDEEWCKRSKVLRMRMHADDEERKMLYKRFLKQTTQNTETNCNDLRARLDSSKKASRYCKPIQVVVTNTTEEELQQHPIDYEEEDSDDAIETGNNSNEPEEGEWTDEAEQVEKESEDETNGDSDLSEKEIQGPKGSVIKVVPRVKPRVASTVWSRLNNTIPEANTNDRSSVRHSAQKSDVRSRLGYHNRNRSPLRIEVKNEKYAEESSDTE